MNQVFTSLSRSFPDIRAMAATHRQKVSSLGQNWSATLWCEGELYTARLYQDLPIYDRVGGGDGFASGLIYGFLTDLGPSQALEYGVAHGALAMTTPGDSSMAQLREVSKLASGGTISINR